MKRKLLSVLLAVSMVAGLAACGNKAAQTPASEGGETSQTAEGTGAVATGSSAPEWGAYNQLITDIRSTTDFAKRVEMMHQAEDMLMDTWAVIPIYYYNDLYMQKADVKNIFATVYGMKYFMYSTKGDAKTLKINLASEPDYLDPALNSSVDGGTLAVNTFAGLYTYDNKGNLIPDIATDMPEVSEDGSTYTVTLRESKWSNGDPLTAQDFVYSWNRVINPDTAADYSYLFDVIARNEDGTLAIEAQDDYTMVIKLIGPCPYFNDLMAFATFYPVHQASVEAANPDGTDPGKWAQEAGFVSNGAYTLQSWNHEESMVYVKNPNYHNAANVTMDELQFMLSADDTAIYAAYNSGNLDYIDTVPTDEISSLIGKNPEFGVLDNLGTYYIGFNVNDPIFAGKTVEQAAKMRKAMCLLIDRGFIVDNIGQCGQVLADSFVPAGMADGNGGIFKQADTSYYDATATGAGMLAEAVKLLEEAGYTMTDNGDGTYSADPGINITYLTNNGTGHMKIAEAIQQDLALAGITIEIKSEEWNVFLENRKAGNFTLAREGWLADYNDPINMLEMFTSDSGNNDMQLGK